MPYLRAPTYRVIRVIDSAGRWRPDFEGKKSCSREMEMDELEPAMEDVGMGWSRVTEQDGAVYYWHEASEQSRWEPPPHSTPNGCGGARLGHVRASAVLHKARRQAEQQFARKPRAAARKAAAAGDATGAGCWRGRCCREDAEGEQDAGKGVARRQVDRRRLLAAARKCRSGRPMA